MSANDAATNDANASRANANRNGPATLKNARSLVRIDRGPQPVCLLEVARNRRRRKENQCRCG
jgi:hypothetical protein